MSETMSNSMKERVGKRGWVADYLPGNIYIGFRKEGGSYALFFLLHSFNNFISSQTNIHVNLDVEKYNMACNCSKEL